MGVGRGVGLGERVAGELLDVGKEALGLLPGEAVGDAALHELLPHLRHDLGLLLAHGLAEDVSLGERKARELLGHEHHLVLVNGEAVGLREDLLQGGVGIGHRLAAVLSLDVIVHHPRLKRPGTVQGQDRDELPELGGGEPPHQGLHPRRLQLKHPVGPAFPDQGVGGFVVQGDLLEVDLHPQPFGNEAPGVVEDR